MYNMSNLILILIGVILIVGPFFYVYYKKHEVNKRVENLEKKLKDKRETTVESGSESTVPQRSKLMKFTTKTA